MARPWSRGRFAIGGLAVFFMALVSASPAAAVTQRFVTGQGTPATTGGSTAAEPKCDLRYAVETVAQPGDEVILDGDVYGLTSPLAVDADHLNIHGAAGQARPSIIGDGPGAGTVQINGFADGVTLRRLFVEFNGTGTAIVNSANNVKYDDLGIGGAGPGVTPGDVGAVDTQQNTSLTNSTIIVNAQPAATHASVYVRTGTLTLRNVKITREDGGPNLGAPALETQQLTGPLAPGSRVDADGLTIDSAGANGVRLLGGASTLRNTTVDQGPGRTDPTGTPVAVAVGADHSRLSNLAIDSRGGIGMSLGADDLQVVDSTVASAGYLAVSMAFAGDHVTLRRVRATSGYVAIASLAAHALVTDTVALSTGVTEFADQAAVSARGGRLDLRNVTAVGSGNQSYGLLNTSASALVVAKNVIARGTKKDVGADGSSPGTISFSNFRTRDPSITNGGHNQSADPRFVDPAHGDYHLRLTSPAIDRGTADPLNGPMDLDRNPRKLGLAVDIGADEVPIDRTRPVIAALSAKNKRFTAGFPGDGDVGAAAKRVPRGTAFRYTLSEPAKVKIAISLLFKGRRVGSRCKPSTPKLKSKPRCTGLSARGSFTVQAVRGRNSTPFAGVLRGKRLAPGKYRATLTATDPSGNVSRPSSVDFTIVGP